MSVLQRVWRFQPPDNTPLDPNNDLVRGIVAGTLGTSPVFIGGTSPIAYTSAPLATTAGVGVRGTSAMQQIARSITTTSDITLLVIGEVTSSTSLYATFAGLSHNGGTDTFIIANGNGTTAGAITGQIYLGSYRTIGGSKTLPVGSIAVVILRHRHNVDQTLWVNGDKDASGGTFTGPTVGNQYWGHYSRSGLYVPCALGLAWDRALSDAEIAKLFDNPWQVFEPRKLTVGASSSSTTYTCAVSGGITFSGSAPQIRERKQVPTGGITFAGTAPNLRTRVTIPNGGVVFGGTAPIVNDNVYTINPSGGVIFSGSPVITKEKILVSTGGINFSGSARLIFVPVGGTTEAPTRITVGVSKIIGVS